MADSFTPLNLTPDADSPQSSSHYDYVPIAPSAPGPGSGPPGPGSLNHAATFPAQPSTPMGPGPAPHHTHVPGGATVYTPTLVPGTELNPRSCVTCRRRKVRCDKTMPCSNCRRALIPCIFPAPERAPRRPRRKDPNALRNASSSQPSSEREIELLKRLRKLEGIVEDLSGQIEVEASSKHIASGSNSPETASLNGAAGAIGGGNSGDAAGGTGMSGGGSGRRTGEQHGSGSNGGSPGFIIGGNNAAHGSSTSLSRQTKDTQKQFGRLMINDYGRARYVSSAFWSKMNDELDALRAETQRLNDTETELSDDENSPLHDVPAADDRPEEDHHAFIFGFQSTSVDLRPLHPLPSQIPYIWQVYQENVDPVVKILHIPTTTKLVRASRTNLDNISPPAEALMFAIYYAAVASLEEGEIQVNFMTDKAALLRKYRFALEQALAKAQFLVSSELVTLQALALLIAIARREEEGRFSWALTGLAIRIAHSLGLHRDGTNFPNLTVFEIEMRRRLFWALCILDMRCAEDQGTELTILEHGVDTQAPLNINDVDITPDSTSLPPSREGITDMTFALIRYEICQVARRLHSIHSVTGPMDARDADLSLEERERLIHDVYDTVEARYLKRSDPNSPMYWVATHVARVICAKMMLVVYQPVMFTRPGDEENVSRDVRDRLFIASTELFEYSYVLTMDQRAKQWRWLFRTYTQWQAVAYLLIECAHRPWGAYVERAWNAANATMFASTSKTPELARLLDNKSLFVPLKKLYNQARKHRATEIERLRNDPDDVARLDLADRVRLKPTMFSAPDERLDGLQWRERWLRLVGAPQLLDDAGTRDDGTGTAGLEPNGLATANGVNGVNMNGVSTGVLTAGGGLDAQQAQAQQQQHQQQQQQQQQQQTFPLVGSQQPQQGQAPGQDYSADILNRVFSMPTFQTTDIMPMLNPDMATNLSEDLGASLPGSLPPVASTTAPAGSANVLFAPFSSTDTDMAPFAPGQTLPLALAGGLGNVNEGAGAGTTTNAGAGATTASGAAPNSELTDAEIKGYMPPWLWQDSMQPMPFQNVLAADDTDFKMDDDFDWQDFGQTLGGMSNGVWSSHGL